MSFGVLVDVCISVLALMILFTLAAAAINEMIADNILNMRGKSLYKAVEGLLRKYGKIALPSTKGFDEEDLRKTVRRFYEHPSIEALMEERSVFKRALGGSMSVKGDHRPPSAIEPAIFARVMADVLAESLAAGQMRDIQAKVGSFEMDFEWTMDRVSGWYVRKVKTSLFVIGLLLVVGSNIDLLRYAQKLALDETLQAKVDATVSMIEALEAEGAGTPAPPAPPAAAAGRAAGGQSLPAADPAPEPELPPAADETAMVKTLREKANELYAQLDEAGAEVGWTCTATSAGGFEPVVFCRDEKAKYLPYPNLPQMIGWLVVAFGVTLGAQFWFDLFRSLVNLRTPGKTNGTVEALSAKN